MLWLLLTQVPALPPPDVGYAEWKIAYAASGKEAKLSPNGALLAVRGDDGAVVILDAGFGQQIHRLEHRSPPRFSPDAQWLATGAVVWNIATGAPTPLESSYGATFAAFSVDGLFVAASAMRVEKDAKTSYALVVWETGQWNKPREFALATAISAVSVRPYAKMVAGYDAGAKKIILLSAETGQAAFAISGVESAGFAFSPDGRILADPTSDGRLRFFDAETGKQAAALARGGRGALTCAAFRPDGKVAAAGAADGTVRFWEVSTRKEIGALAVGNKAVTSIDFGAGGGRLATADEDGKIKLWQLPDARIPVRSFRLGK